jgi:hypothetical protein
MWGQQGWFFLIMDLELDKKGQRPMSGVTTLKRGQDAHG